MAPYSCEDDSSDLRSTAGVSSFVHYLRVRLLVRGQLDIWMCVQGRSDENHCAMHIYRQKYKDELWNIAGPQTCLHAVDDASVCPDTGNNWTRPPEPIRL